MEIPKIWLPHSNFLLLHDTPIFWVSSVDYTISREKRKFGCYNIHWKIFAFTESVIHNFGLISIWTSSLKLLYEIFMDKIGSHLVLWGIKGTKCNENMWVEEIKF